ncbi:MAG: universal stress protein [Pseudomonadota bacterium]|nr:universal stress protein [Pseudomonadota bacterium]MEC8425926.1 universal stress protein [Pseudomonadota bacterium]
MRNILLPFEYIETIPHLVDCAVSLAKKYNSSVSGVAIHQRIDSFIAQEGSIVFDSLHHDENKEEAIKYKEKFMDHINTLKKTDSDLSDLKYKWLSEELENQKYLGDLSRVYNVVIISRPYQELQSASLSSIQTILFDGGRPVMLIPMNKQIDIGKEVVISWNCTTESSRAVFAALPILKKANNVTILTVEKVITEGPSGEQVSELLASHGIDAKPVTISGDEKKIGDAILDFSKSVDADLIVKGAYTQSRLREIIFGGATRHLMLHSEIPIYLVN